MSSIELSRPVALAAELTATDASVIEHLFTTKRILLRLEPALGDVQAAHETLILLVNEVLRFCPNITVELPPAAAQELSRALAVLSVEIHGASTIALGTSAIDGFDATVSIGTEIRPEANWITINSDGWLCRVGTSNGEAPATLPEGYIVANPFGALGAACLGAGQAFLALVGESLLLNATEISLYTLEQGAAGQLAPGPELPTDPVELDLLLVGCGGVGNGWVYAMRRAPAVGRVEAVDHQALQPENLGAYVCATRSRLKSPKVQIAKEELDPSFSVIPRAERFRFFQARFGYGQSYVPEIVISALDNPHTRHEVQRLWAPLTIDLAAEHLTSQIILKQLSDDGMCLIEAHTDLAGEDSELAALATATGLSIERLRDFESQITDEDIAAAPPDKRPALEDARRRRRPICGRVGDLDLHEEQYSNEFAPAVPFVTAFAGIVAAAQTVKAKLEPLASLHFQFSFRSYRCRVLAIRCNGACDCREQQREALPRNATPNKP
ncbi:MAG: ThiF family adenylyltransferase [Gaiellaceae bacterium]